MATQPTVWKSENEAPRPERRSRPAPRRLHAGRDGAGPDPIGVGLRPAPYGAGLRILRWRGTFEDRACVARRAEVADVREAPGRQNLLASLFPLVKRLALKMRARLPASVEVDDLVGAGALGLLDAVDKFDPSKHAKLETYARHRIRGSMLDSLRALDPVSRSVRKKSRKIEKLYRELGNRLGRAVSDEEMAGALGADLPEWYGILEKLQPVAKDGDLGRRARCSPRAGAVPDGDGIPDLRAGPFELLLRREQREILDRALACLPERDRAVITLYYRHELTMQQIATRVGVDESRISQIHSQALARLRRHVQGRLGDLCPAEGVCPLPRDAVGAIHESPLLVLT